MIRRCARSGRTPRPRVENKKKKIIQNGRDGTRRRTALWYSNGVRGRVKLTRVMSAIGRDAPRRPPTKGQQTFAPLPSPLRCGGQLGVLQIFRRHKYGGRWRFWKFFVDSQIVTGHFVGGVGRRRRPTVATESIPIHVEVTDVGGRPNGVHEYVPGKIRVSVEKKTFERTSLLYYLKTISMNSN